MKPYDPLIKQNARKLRSTMTDAEELLWSRLRRKQVLGVQFYRQKPLGSYIVDFYCAAARLVVEIDGSQHMETDHHQKDCQRDANLAAQGLLVLRFDNRQVLKETEGVMAVIYDAVNRRVSVDNPP
ncbi:MAG: DUF559 domain-containing protein [Proteobacteria bacterium]|nr:DUF559 domain-containing protein [Pseudomonadota bacterium]